MLFSLSVILLFWKPFCISQQMRFWRALKGLLWGLRKRVGKPNDSEPTVRVSFKALEQTGLHVQQKSPTTTPSLHQSHGSWDKYKKKKKKPPQGLTRTCLSWSGKTALCEHLCNATWDRTSKICLLCYCKSHPII